VPDVELLDKTEVWVRGVALQGVDLHQLARSAAGALDLDPGAVFVTDARDDHVVFDVLKPRMALASIVGRESALLAALADVPGLSLAADASVHSNGVLGVIGTPADEVEGVLARATEIDDRLRSYVSKRVAVVSTGPEVVAGNITDTNLATVSEVMGRAGFEVTAGGAVLDDEEAIVGRVLRLVSEGYGIVITTGGVGAEDKDRTIEALQRCDPGLVTAVLATYAVGHGRHVKPHVRIGVGSVEWTRLIALPGPNREVQAAMPILLEALESRWEDAFLAHRFAEVLRDCMR
jgi:molybdenum cofactor synthesis domain-containing protein